jgi:prevent-host-death family protein
MSNCTLADARNRFSELVAAVESTHERVVVTKHGRPAVILMSPDDLESLEESIDILSTPGALDDIREAEHEIARGEIFDETAIRADLAARAAATPARRAPQRLAAASPPAEHLGSGTDGAKVRIRR